MTIDRSHIFTLTPSSGVLDPGETQNLTIGFNPDTPGDYDETIDFYIDNSDKPYINLAVRGVGTIPRIIFDRREVVLPVVPLNTIAKAQFTIINEGYESINVRYKKRQDAMHIPFKLDFPDGDELGITKNRIPVEVTFENSKPFSFTAIVDFYHDEDKNKFCSMPISGTTDNCLFSIYPWM